MHRGCCRLKAEPSFAGLCPGWTKSILPSDFANYKAAFQGQIWLFPAQLPDGVFGKMLNEAKLSHQSVGDEMSASADTYVEMHE